MEFEIQIEILSTKGDIITETVGKNRFDSVVAGIYSDGLSILLTRVIGASCFSPVPQSLLHFIGAYETSLRVGAHLMSSGKVILDDIEDLEFAELMVMYHQFLTNHPEH